MELSDFLRAARRRPWILLLPPLLAALASVSLVANDPSEYTASAKVPGSLLMSAPNTPYTGPNAASSFATDLVASVTSPAVVDAVAARTQVDPRSLRAGLSATQVGNGAFVQISYRTPREADAVPVVTAAAASAIESFLRAPMDLARYPMDQAQAEVDAADAALADLARETGLVVPDREYQLRAQQISTLEVQALTAAARGEAETAARLSAVVKTQRTALDSIGPVVARYSQLTATRARAQERLDSTRQAFQAAEAFQKVADPETIARVGPVRAVSKTDQGLRQGLVAAGTALFLAVGILILVESKDRPGLAMVAAPPGEGEPREPETSAVA